MISTLSLLAGFAGIMYWMDRRRKKAILEQRLHDILKLTVTYPYLESPHITENWDMAIADRNKYLKENPEAKFRRDVYVITGNGTGVLSPDFQRYDQFANMIFNYMAEVYHFFHGNQKKIEQFIDMKGWIVLHKQIWLNPSIPGENDCYAEGFKRLLNTYLIEHMDEVRREEGNDNA